MSQAYSNLILSDGPVGYWRLGEQQAGGGVGSVATLGAVDSTGNGNTGTYNHANTQGGNPGVIVNDPDTSVLFSSAGSYVSVPAATSINALGNVFTYEFWVQRRTVSNATMYLMGKGTGSGFIYFNASNQVQLDKFGVSGAVATSVTSITNTAWHYVVVTKNGSTRVMYVDAASGTSNGTDQTMTTTTLAFGIGQPGPSLGAGFFDGYMDEVAVYTKALTAAQVNEHYRVGLADDILTQNTFQAISFF